MPSRKPNADVTTSSLVRNYQREVERQKQLVRKAETAQRNLLFIVGALLAARVPARFVLASASATLATTAVAAGLVSWKLGGSASPVNDAMAFYFVGVATLVPPNFMTRTFIRSLASIRSHGRPVAPRFAPRR